MNQSVICLKCRNVFDVAPQECPVCEHTTFIHFNAKEEPNSICEDLLFTAALVQMGFDQKRLNRSAVPQVPVQMQKTHKLARTAVAARAK